MEGIQSIENMLQGAYALESQDLITFKPQIIKMLDSKTFQLFTDENFTAVLGFLRIEKSMTIPDLVSAFSKNGLEKSESTVYRYIQKLIKKGLVTKSGKRITSVNPEEIRSETLYSRTARVFVDKSSITDDLDEEKESEIDQSCKICDLSAALLAQLFPDKKLDTECFSKIITKIEQSRIKLFTDLVENAEKEVLDEFDDISFEHVKEIINLTGWVAAMKTFNFDKEIDECTNSKK